MNARDHDAGAEGSTTDPQAPCLCYSRWLRLVILGQWTRCFECYWRLAGCNRHGPVLAWPVARCPRCGFIYGSSR
jgi:hypothetical protein